ncbi:alpha/beta hydrolase [Nostoc sp. UHCC 0870]|uniref:alpha/beta hydrolase n=1 Tax=Nostoc sp. UHCC 0870 TaxID=2914041 RepID=UPI001EDD8B11|nr:alpha/beta hydrolase [Nostoc sp. UHCC 0870]UKO98766.1 alpha/beta hydrolase [Nostoc sp. UHCC 0870]
MQYDRRILRKLIQSLTEPELTEALDEFPAVRKQFTDRQPQALRDNIILDYFEKHQEEFPVLLTAIKNCNPIAYEKHVSALKITPNPEPPKQDIIPEEKTCDILFLAANPIGTQLLQLEKEANLIREQFKQLNQEKNYIVKVEIAVNVEELSKYLRQYKPLIVHFSSHGSPSGEIILNNAQGEQHLVSPEALANLLVVLDGRIECVVLNACFSLEKADALADKVSCVVGMKKEIDDRSAVAFSAGFYRSLADGQQYYTAFNSGIAEIKLRSLPDSVVPHFITRDTSILDREVITTRVTRGPLSPPPPQSETTIYPLWFGTNRKPNNPQDISQGFSRQRDRNLHYGTCKVAVPKSHKFGSTGSSFLYRLLNSTDDRLKLQEDSLKLLQEQAFLQQVQQTLQANPLDKRSALVYIHGFNVSFEDAALRAAQIGFDLDVPGIMAFYSWPSRGRLASYIADAATMEASEIYIAEFLLNLAQNSGAEKIHIIAHSMGNRGLIRVMQRILTQVQADSNIRFGQIFLAAPDVDPDLFQQLAAAYQKLAERTTLYISSKDKALATSGIIHDHPRAGFSPPITVVDGIDTIEVSNIDLTFLGHGYFAEARDLLQDMYSLLHHNQSPNQRFGLQQMQQNGQDYWVVGK